MSENAGAPASVAPVEAAQPQATEQSPQNVAQGSAPTSAAEVQDAVDAGDITPAEANKLIKKFDLKVRGKTISREVDLGDEDYIRNQLQLAEVSKQSMQESAELKKAYQSELARLKSDPWKVLAELGMDPDQLAEMRIQDRIEQLKKTPDQIEREKEREELRQAREESAKLKKEKDDLYMQKLNEQAGMELRKEIDGALSTSKILPKNDKSIKRIADAMHWAINEHNMSDITAEQVLAFVEEDYRREIGSLMDDSPEEVLETLIGQKNLERMRKKRLASKRATVSPETLSSVKPTAGSVPANQQKQEQRKISAKDFFKNPEKYTK